MKFEFPEVNKISFEAKEAVALIITPEEPKVGFEASGETF